jgi:hypothetical protein
VIVQYAIDLELPDQFTASMQARPHIVSYDQRQVAHRYCRKGGQADERRGYPFFSVKNR